MKVRGHLFSKLDPLLLTDGKLYRGPEPHELLPTTYGFTEADMDRPIDLAGDLILGFLHSGRYVTSQIFLDSYSRCSAPTVLCVKF